MMLAVTTVTTMPGVTQIVQRIGTIAAQQNVVFTGINTIGVLSAVNGNTAGDQLVLFPALALLLKALNVDLGTTVTITAMTTHGVTPTVVTIGTTAAQVLAVNMELTTVSVQLVQSLHLVAVLLMTEQ